MSTQLLGHKTARQAPGVKLHPQITLELGRVHEACGPARRSFAMWLASQTQGPVLWISPAWEPGQLNPDGMMAFADPARFIFVHPTRAEDLLWCLEEALRSGAIPLIIGDLPGAPGLTPIRRMHLAAEQGGAMGRAPLGLLLTPGDGGAQGVETRWHMAATHRDEARIWALTRRRARALPPVTWQATMTAARAGLHLERIETEDTPA
ncbi:MULTISPECIES: ImuA family protein [Ruegeria]|jgi:protein ImuA|uniref:Protein ImuA n=1 Tax=Ruegeria atlantica TaxID=81569 RepID=A0AA90YST5_9RHOB|nr:MULTISPECIES: hypothetical protein [Ruegeria]NOD83656.1 hypothetical protein [Ruegeria sp. HKCCD6119]NOE17390.1 hypothetical protein [Ruegeria atlantica]QFT72634.1 hypothetical protein FIU92_06305 [Ruegeria sp. THAF33]